MHGNIPSLVLPFRSFLKNSTFSFNNILSQTNTLHSVRLIPIIRSIYFNLPKLHFFSFILLNTSSFVTPSFHSILSISWQYHISKASNFRFSNVYSLYIQVLHSSFHTYFIKCHTSTYLVPARIVQCG